MVKAILLIAASLLVILGICEVIHAICILLIVPKRPINNYCIVNLSEEKAYYQLRFAIEQLRWNGDNYAEKIIAITDSISQTQYNRCKIIAQNNGVILCESSSLPYVIRYLSS